MRAEQLTRALGGRWHGQYGAARCPAHDDRNPSLSIRDGEAGALLLHCFTGCQYRDIRAALKFKLGDGAINVSRTAWAVPNPKSAAAANAELASRIWAQTVPIPESQAEAYLRQRRITCALPDTLRFHPALRHPTGEYLPVMAACVEKVDDDTCAIHRTYLDSQAPRKTDRLPAKAMLGSCRGGAVRLSEGRTGLVVCEGIETGLSLCDAIEGHAIWAALSASGLVSLRLPDANRFGGTLLIACDGDPAGRKSGQALGERSARIGWAVELVSAPDGQDFNDLAQIGGGHV
jgi:hypothetical protein